MPRRRDDGEVPSNATSSVPRRSTPQVFGEALVRECNRDPRIVGITAAMNSGTGLNILQQALPERYFDVGIAEQQAILFVQPASRLPPRALKPVAAIYSTFLQRAFDQIVHDVCLQKLNVVFAMDRAGLVGDDGPTHHGAFDIAYLRCLPNIVLMALRADEAMLVNMLRTLRSTTTTARSQLPATRAARATRRCACRAEPQPGSGSARGRSCEKAGPRSRGFRRGGHASRCSATAAASARRSRRPPS